MSNIITMTLIGIILLQGVNGVNDRSLIPDIEITDSVTIYQRPILTKFKSE